MTTKYDIKFIFVLLHFTINHRSNIYRFSQESDGIFHYIITHIGIAICQKYLVVFEILKSY